MAKFNINSTDYNAWITHLKAYIPGLDKCTDNIQIAEAVNGYRGMIRSNSKEDRETSRFLTRVCGFDYAQVQRAGH